MRRLCGEGVRSYLGRSHLAPERATTLSWSEKSAVAVGTGGSTRRYVAVALMGRRRFGSSHVKQRRVRVRPEGCPAFRMDHQVAALRSAGARWQPDAAPPPRCERTL